MTSDAIEIIPCPPALTFDAIALALADLTPEQRREFAPVERDRHVEALMVAVENGQLRGAAWGQRQPGSTAIFWPPRLCSGVDRNVAIRLARAVVDALDAAGIRMTQVLLQDRDSPTAKLLQAVGFARLTELLYLSWETGAAPPNEIAAISFETYADSKRERLAALIERTYEATQDCPNLGGKRPLDEVLEGYRSTGVFCPENWLFARESGRDVGVLLLTEHPAAKHWELLYMGLVQAARGRQLGCAVVQHAQRLAHAAGTQRIVLAVDAENFPAIKMYNNTGFVVWDSRTVFVRFAARDSESQESS